MLKHFYVVMVLLFFSYTVQAQEHYYWAYGEKYPLELYADKQYILTKGYDKHSVASDLAIAESDVSNLRELIISKSIKNTHSNVTEISDGLYWGFVNSFLTKENVRLSEVIYAAPSFFANGKEVSLSQFFYVKLKGEQDFKLLDDFAKENKVEIIGNDSFMPLWYVLACDKNSKGNALEMANRFYETGMFMAAQPDLMEDHSANCSDDTFFNQQWHLNNTGQGGGTEGNDIRICQAWDITMGCDDVVVAVLDQGLEFNHPDFANISPISFDSETGASPAPTIYGNHGVAVSGVIAASANNTLGVAGVAPNVQLMSINNSLAPTPLSRQNRADGINFSWQNGASVINNSWGSAVVYQIIDDAIEAAVTLGRNGLGSIVVFASGNDSNNSIGYPSNNVNSISVGAIGRTAIRASFSNYGTGLDVVAPGVEITTTDREGAAGYNGALSPNGDYTAVDGTSFAAPQVAGVAALILSVNPTLTFQEVRNIIESTTDKVGGVTYTLGAGEQAGLTWNNQMGYGRVNAFSAVRAALPIVSGPDLLCSSSAFTLQNLPAGTTATWSVTPSGQFTGSTSGSGTTATLTPSSTAAAQATLTYTITTACGNTQVQRVFWVGKPATPPTPGVLVNVPPNRFTVFLTLPTEQGVTSYNWYVGGILQSGEHSATIRIPWKYPHCGNSYLVQVEAVNSCGISPKRAITLFDPPCFSSYSLRISPNPATSEVEIAVLGNPNVSGDNGPVRQEKVIEEETGELVLYDRLGNQLHAQQMKEGRVTINVQHLKPGTYVVKYYSPEGVLEGKLLKP